MSLLEAFIAVWALSYIICVYKKTCNVPYDQLLFPVWGLLMMLNLLVFKNPVLYLLLGIVEVIGGVMSFLGDVKWKLSWTGDSGVAQVMMALGDFLAATALFLLAGVF